jgi:hypothetical protein
MMFVYYGYTFPEHAISRGFYRDGVWPTPASCGGADLGGLVEGRGRCHARPDLAPEEHRSRASRSRAPYGQARRLLRDRVKAHDIHIGGPGWIWAAATIRTRCSWLC